MQYNHEGIKAFFRYGFKKITQSPDIIFYQLQFIKYNKTKISLQLQNHLIIEIYLNNWPVVDWNIQIVSCFVIYATYKWHNIFLNIVTHFTFHILNRKKTILCLFILFDIIVNWNKHAIGTSMFTFLQTSNFVIRGTFAQKYNHSLTFS